MPHSWITLETICRVNSPFVSLIAEKVEDEKGALLSYWRVERDHSIVILPLQGDHLLVAGPFHRQGLGKQTYDFPGGRLKANENLRQSALSILNRELGVPEQSVIEFKEMTSRGWPINSSFSNQRLFGCCVRLSEDCSLTAGAYRRFPLNKQGIFETLELIECLQCRTVLLQWIFQTDVMLLISCEFIKSPMFLRHEKDERHEPS